MVPPVEVTIDAAPVVEAPSGFLQGEEDSLGIGIEGPVVVLLGTIREWLDDYVGGVGDYDVQPPKGPPPVTKRAPKMTTHETRNTQ